MKLRKISSLSLSAVLGSLFVLPVYAQQTALDCPTGTEPKYGTCIPTAAQTGLTSQEPAVIVMNVVTWLLTFVGALAVLMIIVGGIMYMTSTGDETRIDTAKRILIFAIIGLIVALLAWVIVNTIISNL